jgi:uncharacterized membrane protein AbrB (regulator of aidB expression)
MCRRYVENGREVDQCEARQAVTLQVIQAVAADGLVVGVSLLATLLLSVAVEFVLSKTTAVDRPTGAFGMIAGGASGVVVVSEDAGADAALDAVMQYLRVLVVVFSIPLVTALAGGGGGEGGPPVAAGGFSLSGLLFCVVVAGVRAGLAALVKLQSSGLLAPMLVSAAVAIVWPGLIRHTPQLLPDAAFLVVGLQIGLRFSLARLRPAACRLPAILLAILAVIVGCAAIGVGMAWTGRPFFECYLATTPGGLNAVLAAVVHSGHLDRPIVRPVAWCACHRDGVRGASIDTGLGASRLSSSRVVVRPQTRPRRPYQRADLPRSVHGSVTPVALRGPA